MTVSAIRAAVIGAGAIGARLDAPGAATPLTHAGGYRAAGIALVAMVDIDDQALAAAGRWGCRPYRDVDAMMREEKPAVVSVATPTAVRAKLLRRLLPHRPRAVVAEKPLTASAAEAEDIAAAYRREGVPLIVNYTRRFVPAWRRLAQSAAMTATIRYAKGVRHNGTHAIDLCRMLFGECVAALPLAAKHDHWPDDPTISAFLRFERCPEVYLQALDERCFTLFEADIIAPSWRVVVDRDGRRLRRFAVQEDAGEPPGKRLMEAGEEDTGGDRAMLNLMRHLIDVLDGAVPWCGGDDAAAAQRIAERLAA